jgi:2-keto-4-pentenoate hydratase/2-oxohepta-3-ene-1,7-dioic acid hydratase in catechol pathway
MNKQHQVIGVGYTYQPSLAVRKSKTRDLEEHHSSQSKDFTYFYKGLLEDTAAHDEPMLLQTDPRTRLMAQHWVEPELAIMLGERHEIAAYTLANDLTAFSIELAGRTERFDGTYHGKCWTKSAALGPKWYSLKEVHDDGNLTIGLKIERAGVVIYDHSYNTSRRKRLFTEIPEMILAYREEFGNNPPLSKTIAIQDGFLLAGTIIMLGTGVVVPERCYSEPGDIATIYCPELNASLTNELIYKGLLS